MFYIGTTALLSKQSIYSINMPLLAVAMFILYVVNILWVKCSDSGTTQDSISSEGTPAPQCDTSGGSCPRTGSDHYKLYAAPSGSEAKHWIRQLGYDLA